MVEISTYQIGIFVFDLTFSIEKKCAKTCPYVSTLRGYFNFSDREGTPSGSLIRERQETVRVPSLSTERLSFQADTSAQCSTALQTVGYYMLATLEASGRRHGTRADRVQDKLLYLYTCDLWLKCHDQN